MKKSEVKLIPDYYAKYLESIPDQHLNELLEKGLKEIEGVELSETESLFRYSEGKWSVKEVLQHLIDCERVFAYRALCISRGESIKLPGFDQNSYVANSEADDRKWESIKDEFIWVRNSSISLFQSFTPGQLSSVGNANGSQITVAAIGFIIVGHQRHHFDILRSRYSLQL